jgi:hypothetical protein
MPPNGRKVDLCYCVATPGSYKVTTVGETHWNDVIIVGIISCGNWMSLGEVPGTFWHCEGVLIPRMIPRFMDLVLDLV